jgi:nitrogen fixation protein FixH
VSFIGRVPPAPPAAPRRSVWRWFPWAMVAAMLVVFAANGGLIYWALATFPGATNNDGFDESNAYDRVLAAVASQDALGWSISADAKGDRAIVRFRDAQGHALGGLVVTAAAERPLGPKMTTRLSFTPAADGVYAASTALPQKGQWDLLLSAATGERRLRVTRRIVVQ